MYFYASCSQLHRLELSAYRDTNCKGLHRLFPENFYLKPPTRTDKAIHDTTRHAIDVATTIAVNRAEFRSFQLNSARLVSVPQQMGSSHLFTRLSDTPTIRHVFGGTPEHEPNTFVDDLYFDRAWHEYSKPVATHP